MKSLTYPDHWLILAGSWLIGYFFVTIGLDDSLFDNLSRPAYLRDWAGASLITAVVWLSVRAITVWLDRRYDWFTQTTRRVVGQLGLGVGLPVGVSLLLSMLYFRYVVGQPITESTYPVYEFPISVLFIVGFNLLYLGLYLLRKATAQPAQPQPDFTSGDQTASMPTAPARRTLVVNSGLRNIPIPTDDVAYAYIDEATVFLTTFSGAKYVIGSSLDELARDLPPELFFRINRQFIIHRRACSSYLNEAYGKLKVEVKPALPKDIIVSQQKTPEFKKWLEESL